ncbi:MAG: D-glycero-beta-D-manno-heptose-1,7-bisphosphate 7-phosphatase [Gammaproteobacteria bacterium]|nr:MAG: D-glycero-beta-D-manno-heptose-1,7-bisphosphate 7-phosphatase [Gammaproteobacteria bacterium]
MTQPLIILDRDGVINYDSDNYIKSEEEWLPIPSSLTAIAQLTKAGYLIAIASNQSGLSRNYFTLQTLENIHQKMFETIKDHGGQINAIEFCPDHPDNPGPNRKPAPGMVNKLLEQFQAQAGETWFVGDSISDIYCALNAGCKPALVLTGKGRKTQKIESFDNNIPVFNDLLAFTNHILN